MKSYILILTYVTCALAWAQAPAPNGFVEQWVLSKDRSATLTQLIPDTDDYFFYHALHYQHTGKQKEFTSIMNHWDEAITKNKVNYSRRYAVMKNRGIILDYKNKPAESIRRLSTLLELELNHQRPIPPEDAVIPSQLDASSISPEAFLKETSSEAHPYRVYDDHMIYQELSHVSKFDRSKRLWFLQNIRHAGAPETAQLFLSELKHESKPSFSKVPGHQYLFLEQLQWLEKQHPALRDQSTFVHAVIKRMRPGDAHYLLHHPAEKKAWLTETWKYIADLSPVHNSLKAHILYHLLESHRYSGDYPEDLLKAYLAIPRTKSAQQIQQRNTKNAASLSINYSALTTLPPIRNDEELLSDYLQHVLAKKETSTAYAKLLPEEILHRLHAEAKLLAGAAPSTWGKKLSPEYFQQLRERTEVRLSLQNKQRYSTQENVSLILNLKNTPSLEIQIYEVDSLSHIKRTGTDPSVEIKLNGLVPHHKFTQNFDKNPLLRHQYTLPLPQLKGRGIWIVECISKGVSCRALIKKGSLQMLVSNSAAQQIVTILDENQNPVYPAQVWLLGKTYPTDKNGKVSLPLASSVRSDTSIIHAPNSNGSGLAEAHRITRRTPDYALSLKAGTDREQLLAGKKATLLLRPRLSNNGEIIPIKQLKNTSLHITAQLRGNISTELTSDNVTFVENGITTRSISLPEDVRSITISLNGEVQIPGRDEPTKLTTSASMKINGVSDTNLLAQPLLAFTTKGWVVELLGRNGEPMPKRALTIQFHRYGFRTILERTLRTDAEGKIHLGALNGIEAIDIARTEFSTALSSFLTTADSSSPSSYHIQAGESIEIIPPLPIESQNLSNYACLYRHSGDVALPVQNMGKHLSFTDGKIIIKDLAAGKYAIQYAFSKTPVEIHVIKGRRNGSWISDGSHSLEYGNSKPLEISNIQTQNGTISGSVSATNKEIQLLIIGTRYFHDDDHFQLLHRSGDASLVRWQHGFSGNEWLNGRKLSDEYRYILERRQAEQFPGNMLPRPGLILNRWKREDSNPLLSDGGSGAGGSATFGKKAAKKIDGGRSKPNEKSSAGSPSYDFLAKQSVIHTGIKLADDGTFSLPTKDFAHCQSITILAYNAAQTSSRMVPLPATNLTTRERRLDRNLDPQKHYTGSRATAILTKGATAEILNVLDADWRAYTSLGHVHDYFHTNGGTQELRAFGLLMQWPKLTEKQRSRAAHLLASHEFHLFAYFKDRKWFDKNIKPVLEQKRHRTFIDDFLLGNNLAGYLDPWKYERLNAAEKALLARALPDKRAAIVKDLQHRFELTHPTPEQETLLFASALRQNSLALRDRLGLAARDLSMLEHAERSSAGVQYIEQKINSIVIPFVDFENTTLAEALDFLRLRTHELDPEPDPAMKGMRFTIRGSQLSNKRIKELKLRNVPVNVLLKYLCDSTRTRYRQTKNGIEIMPLSALEVTDLYTRTISVPPDFISKLGDDGADPFGDSGDDDSTLKARYSTKELLRRNGIQFPEGSFVTYNARNSMLVVRNTLGNLDIIDQITQSLSASAPEKTKSRLTTNRKDSDYGGRAPLLPSSDGEQPDPFGGVDYDEPPELPNQVSRRAGGKFPVSPATPVEPEDLTTHIWSESHYYRHPNLDDGPKILPNRFWIEFAAHDGKSPFLSARFPECTDSTASMLIALAVLDLPFEGEKPDAQIEKLTLKVVAKSPMLLFYRDTRETDKLAENSPLLVQQKFFRHGDRTRNDEAGKEVENPVTGEFLAGVPYTASFIITNPTGTARELQVLTQIPRGSIPLGKSPETHAREIKLRSHSTIRIEYSFYFPTAGVFPHFPAHVLERGTVLAFSQPAPLKVLAHSASRDTRSWAAIARDGTDAALLARMEKINLHQTPLAPILWRLSNKEFYQSVITLLRKRLHYDPSVYAYGFKHADRDAVSTYLENAKIADELGAYFSSPLITLNNRERGAWEHLEFAPLVNARQHKFQGYFQLLNTEAQEQYLNVLDAIAWKASPTQDDLLTLSYQLFLQDRVSEALEVFARVKRDETPAKMQYDYMQCYALFYQEKPAKAAQIATRWKDVPSVLWKKRFAEVASQADEIAGLDKPAAKKKKPSQSPAPSLEMRSEGGALAFDFQSIKSATLRLYAVDLEVLFSENPFLDKHTDLNPPIRPNHVAEIKFPQGKTKHLVTLPANMRLGNVLAMVESGGLQRVLALDSQAIRMTRDMASRTLRVTSAEKNKPLPRSYVKIYIETTDGNTEFYKDGYTDLRGMFPYEAHTRIPPHRIKRYAIFTSHPKLGSKIMVTQ